jgi:hypothetical protein
MIKTGRAVGAHHAFDCVFWVELRGFEPLTPSMREEVEGAN